MSTSKRDAVVGIAYETTPKTGETAPILTPVCESANIVSTPGYYQRINNSTPDPLGFETFGFDHSFTMTGCEGWANIVGYMYWLCLGTDTFVAQNGLPDNHTITPETNNGQYFTFFVDRQEDIDSVGTDTTEALAGCKITELTMDMEPRSFCKFSMSGVGLSKALEASFNLSIPTGDDNHPLSWKACMATAEEFEIGYNGAAVATDNTITSLQIRIARTQNYSNLTLASEQPSDLVEGAREVFVTLTRDFTGTAVETDYTAWTSYHDIETRVWFQMGTTPYKLNIHIPSANVINSYPGEVGTGDDAIVGTLECQAYDNGTDPVIRVYTEDGQATAYPSQT